VQGNQIGANLLIPRGSVSLVPYYWIINGLTDLQSI